MIDSAIIGGGASPARFWGNRESDLSIGSVAEYPHLEYSMNAVRRAGKRIAKTVHWNPDQRDEIIRTFTIANSWRDSHVLPMRSIRLSIIQRMRHGRMNGFTAARPKRLSSIRKKLQRLGCQLDQINDLGGCRAVLHDIDAVNTLMAECRERVPHEVRQEYPYIEAPKHDGYRSHHMVYRFHGKGDRKPFDGRRIELQIRTRLQHSWATAVEAVGLFRGEDMKAGQGDPEWLRLFQLMSAEFAHTEKCAPVPGMPDRSKRIAELRDLNAKLGAASFLDDLKNATRFVRGYVYERGARYYLLRYDHAKRSVEVEPHFSAVEGTKALSLAEQVIELEPSDNAKVVLVEVDKIDSLVEAYPNYFGDVSLFIENLKYICGGKQAIEYSMAPQQIVAPRPYEKPDMSWLKQRHRRWE